MIKTMHWIAQIDIFLRWLLIILMSVLLLDVTWQVLTRFILPTPSSFTEELARFLLIWIGLLGSVHAYRHKMHLGIDIIVRSLSTKSMHKVNYFVQCITILFALAVFGYGGGKLVYLAFYLSQYSPAMQINMGYVYLALPLSGVLLCLFAFEQLLQPPVAQTNNDETHLATQEERA